MPISETVSIRKTLIDQVGTGPEILEMYLRRGIVAAAAAAAGVERSVSTANIDRKRVSGIEAETAMVLVLMKTLLSPGVGRSLDDTRFNVLF